MKSSLNRLTSYIRVSLVLLATSLLWVTTVSADVRGDAESAITQLHLNSAAAKFPDDLKSLDLAHEVALRYFMVGDKENADKFYLLTLQKIRVIEAMIKTAEIARALEAADTQLSSGQMPSADATENEKPDELNSSLLVGSKGVYTVVKADTMRLVASKLGVTQQHLRTMNNLTAKASIKVGQKLAYNNRKIIPQQLKDGLIINIPDRTLYYFQRGALVTSFPVALGSVTKNEKYDWQTPVGKFKITAKMKDPTWTVPTSIQSEMEEQGKDVITSIPAGPENPLGKYAIKTTIPGILIHSTTRPASIYSFSSHGCIRLAPPQMEEFFPQIKVNTRGEIIYKPVKLAVTESGRIFLEVHRDIYNKGTSLVAEARQLVEKKKLSGQIDWEKLKTVVKQERGIAEDISQ